MKSNSLDCSNFYLLHPTLKPFVGKNFEKYKILMVGESHYINTEEGWGENEFKSWWDEKVVNIIANMKYNEYINTNRVVQQFIAGSASRASCRIFGEPLKIFESIVLGCNNEEHCVTNYHHFAFMNFFPIPSFVKGKDMWSSIKYITSSKQKRMEYWDIAVKYAVQLLDSFIDTQKPELVVFTSIFAKNAYFNSQDSKHKNDELVQFTSHPMSPVSWNKSLKSLGGKNGAEKLAEIFSAYVKQKNKI